jgi:hypothetical protein
VPEGVGLIGRVGLGGLIVGVVGFVGMVGGLGGATAATVMDVADDGELNFVLKADENKSPGLLARMAAKLDALMVCPPVTG